MTHRQRKPSKKHSFPKPKSPASLFRPSPYPNGTHTKKKARNGPTKKISKKRGVSEDKPQSVQAALDKARDVHYVHG